MLWNIREKKESRRRVFGISKRTACNFNQGGHGGGDVGSKI